MRRNVLELLSIKKCCDELAFAVQCQYFIISPDVDYPLGKLSLKSEKPGAPYVGISHCPWCGAEIQSEE